MAAKLIDKTAAATATTITAAFRRIPKALRHTLTLDNGKEFARFRDIEKGTGVAVYFADPYSAWQRGTNENTHGLLRRYFPKGSGFSDIADETLVSVVKKLNHRPRQCLGYRTPHEVFQEAKRGVLGKWIHLAVLACRSRRRPSRAIRVCNGGWNKSSAWIRRRNAKCCSLSIPSSRVRSSGRRPAAKQEQPA